MTYLSGPIFNENEEIKKKNLLRFFEVAQKFPEHYNPAQHETEEPNETYEHYLARDVIFIIENKPSLYMMKGWETSKGAKLEHAIAKQLDLPIEYEK